MNSLSATSIARVQTMAHQLRPAPAPEAPSMISEGDQEALEAIQALRRPLIPPPLGAQSLRPEAPLRLALENGKLTVGNFRQGNARGPSSLAALTYAAHGMDVNESTRSPVLDLLV